MQWNGEKSSALDNAEDLLEIPTFEGQDED